MVVLLDILGLILASTALNELHQSADESAVFKYYSNRKGSQVVEVNRENRCHIFENGHANWIQGTRKGLVTTLNYIQFQLLLQKCQLDVSQKRGDAVIGDEAHDGVGLGDGSGQIQDENDLNQNIINRMWNESQTPGILPQFEQHGFIFNETDVSHFMEDNSLGNSTENSTSSGSPLIFPGTRWCGRGDIARSDDDIGIYAETDKCCRDHDKCPESIVAKQCKYELCNNGGYTWSHCECDEKFLQCLESDNSLSSLTSFKIANLYFNILKPTCFARKHPIQSCQRKRLSGECIAFQYDFQRPITWQFFPARPYIVRPARNLFDSLVYSHSDLSRLRPTSMPMPDTVFNSLNNVVPTGFSFGRSGPGNTDNGQ